MKFVPQSDLSCFAGPRMAKNLLSALMQLKASTALVLMQVNRIAQRLLSACPPPVRRVTTDQGPKTSKPTYENGGSVLSRSAGRSAIFCSSVLPRSFLQVTH